MNVMNTNNVQVHISMAQNLQHNAIYD